MPLLADLRRSPFLAGTLLLALAAGLIAPAVSYFGWRHWPYYAGALAVLLLAFGTVERLWQSRALPRPPRTDAKRRRFRLVSGGKTKGKGNGHAHAGPDDSQDGPRWVM
jgi:protein-S-isoprenylcysteine O-methyltransferase Ste14